MRLVLLSLILSLALFAGAVWAFRHGAAYELRDFSDAARISILDTTTIGEKWVVIAGGAAAAAFAALLLPAFLNVRNRNSLR